MAYRSYFGGITKSLGLVFFGDIGTNPIFTVPIIFSPHKTHRSECNGCPFSYYLDADNHCLCGIYMACHEP